MVGETSPFCLTRPLFSFVLGNVVTAPSLRAPQPNSSGAMIAMRSI